MPSSEPTVSALSLAERLRASLGSVFWITLAASAIRVVTVLYLHRHFPPSESYPVRTEIGRVAFSIATGTGFSSPFVLPSGPTAWTGPIYPYLVAGAFKIWGPNTLGAILAIHTFASVCSGLTCIPIWTIGRTIFGERTGRLAAWLWALVPGLILLPVQIVWETAFSALCFALAFQLTLEVADSSRLSRWLRYGIAWTVAALTNPALLAPLPFLLVWAGLQRRKGSQAWVKPALLTLLVLAIGVTPWLVRNYLVFGRFVFLRSNLGLELYLGNHPESPDNWAYWHHPSESPDEQKRFARMGEIPYIREKQRLALEYVRTHPRHFVMLTLNRVVYFWTGTTETLQDREARQAHLAMTERSRSFLEPEMEDVKPAVVDVGRVPPDAGLEDVQHLLDNDTGPLVWTTPPRPKPGCGRVCSHSYALLAPLGLLGLLLAGRCRIEGIAPFAITLGTFPLVYYVTHHTNRFRHPIDPLLVILTAWVLLQMWEGLRRKPASVASCISA